MLLEARCFVRYCNYLAHELRQKLAGETFGQAAVRLYCKGNRPLLLKNLFFDLLSDLSTLLFALLFVLALLLLSYNYTESHT